MKTIIIALIILLFISKTGFTQFPNFVKAISAKPNASIKVKGNLNLGEQIDDLTWAWRSSVACFPGTQKSKFNGNHVLYSTIIPPKSIMRIKVIPDDKNTNFSLYGYQIGTTNYSVVPNLSSCVSCEADHKWDYKRVGKVQDHTRSIEFNAIKNPYNVVIGVTGANGLRAGGYTLEIELKGGENTRNLKQEEVKLHSIKSEKGKTLSYEGNLSSGIQIHDLSWAWSSSVACFPETQMAKFTGNHVIYITEIPRYSKMEIQLVPKDANANFSLYAYEIGMNSKSIVPNLPSCVTCEVDHKWDRPKRGLTQDHTRSINNLTAINNPYKVVIGVVGANGLKEGAYTLKIKLQSR